MGLSSILLHKLGGDVTATDHHPSVNHFLIRNTLLNNDSAIPFERVGWIESDDQLGLFDLIIGSDLLYEDEHIEQLSKFLVSHAHENCEIVIVDPARGRKAKLMKQLEKYGFLTTVKKISKIHQLQSEFKGVALTFIR
mgnify:CR=1 FL=1